MINIVKLFTLFLLSLCSASTAFAMLDSQGQDFFITFNNNDIEGPGNLSLLISSEKVVSGTVSISGLSFTESFDLQPFESINIDLPSTLQQHIAGETSNLAVRVTADEEVKVYGVNQRRFTSDAFLALPTDVLGVEYLTLHYSPTFRTQISIVAINDQTEVVITPKNATSSGEPAGIPYTVSLNSGETYYLTSSADLTGTSISSNFPIGVTTGNYCVNIPDGVSACDHIVEMIPPVSTLGEVFLSVPLATRTRGDVYRMLASADDTVISVNSVEVAQLDRGDFHEMVLDSSSLIEASRPILVAQYSPGTGFDNVTSDPFMMLLPPAGQYLTQYTFETLPASLNFSSGFTNVLIPTADIDSLILDGSQVDASLFQQIQQTEFSGAQIQLEEGVHEISASVPFGISVYGFGSFDSYGYPGGMAFELINPGGDKYNPFVKLMPMGNSIEGIAGDFEDLNLNGLIDIGEDINANNVLDQRTEDINGNNQLDAGEDTNNDGLLDRDTGVFRIELEDGFSNLELSLDSFIPGSSQTNFTISLIDPALSGIGVLVVTDGAGNQVTQNIAINDVERFQNVRVISTLSGDDIGLDQTSFTQTPDDIQLLSSGAVIQWDFANFEIDQVEDLDYEVILQNPRAGETRLVTQSLELIYLDINGNEVRQTLGEQSVEVGVSVFNIDVTTDKPQYTANETVQISPEISNLSELTDTTTVRVFIKNEDGQLVQDLGFINDFEVNGGESKVLTNVAFETAGTLAGSYFVVAELLDENGEVSVQDEAPFQVVTDNASGVDLTSILNPGDVYQGFFHTTDNVQIDSIVRNLTSNQIIEDAEFEIRVFAPNDQEIHSETSELGDITPLGQQPVVSIFPLINAPIGTYIAITRVLSDLGEELARAAVPFEVAENLRVSITGSVEVQFPLLKSGELQQCTYIVNNSGTVLQSGEFRLLSTNMDLGEVITSEELELVIPASDSIEKEKDISTQGFAAGNYACVLQQQIDDIWITLDIAYFEVTEIDLMLMSEQGVDDSAVLFLLDSSTKYGWYKHNDPYGPKSAPDLNTQRAFLERVMDATGIPYSIVDNVHDFTHELRTGRYGRYVLLTERENLPHWVQKELREAVFRGEGLIEAGRNFRVHTQYLDTLGVKFRSINRSAKGIVLNDSQLHSADSIHFTHPERALKAVLHGAEQVAEFMGGNSKKPYYCKWKPWHHSCKTQTSPAITINEYGKGNTVYMAFDLLMEATALNANDGLFVDLLLNSIAYVQPKELKPLVGTAYPITFTVDNKQAATLGRLVFDIPADLVILNAGDGEVVDGQWQSLFDLGETESQTMTLWVEVPVSPIDINVQVQSGEAPNWVDEVSEVVSIAPEGEVEVLALLPDVSKIKGMSHFNYTYKAIRHHLSKGHYEIALKKLLLVSNVLSKSDSEMMINLRLQNAIAIRALVQILNDQHLQSQHESHVSQTGIKSLWHFLLSEHPHKSHHHRH